MNAAVRDIAAKDRETVRTVIQGLILAGVIWVASSIHSQNASIVKLQTQMDTLQASLANMPGLTERVTKVEDAVRELTRRQDEDERLRREPGK